MNEMLVSREQFKRALDLFIDKTYTPKVPASDYLFYFGKLAIMNNLLSKNWNRLADENGMVDITEFYKQYSRMFNNTQQVEFQGFTLNKNDLNELMGFLKAQVQNNQNSQN